MRGWSLPVTKNSDEHLSDDDTNDFEICDGSNPVLGTDLVGFPTCTPYSFEKRCQVTNREEHISIPSQFNLWSPIALQEITLQDPAQHPAAQLV